MMTTRILVLSVVVAALSGCLKTRAEIEAEQSGADQQKQTTVQHTAQARETTKPVYKEKAPAAGYRFEEVDEQMRAMSGRVDSAENKVEQEIAIRNTDRDAVNKNFNTIDQRFGTYEEAIKKLELQVQELSNEVAQLKAAPPVVAAAKVQPAEPVKVRSVFDEGEDQFNAHKWKEAILNYQKYRDTNPKGKLYADASYKIGVCFQELGMKDEAKSFYEEVSAKFPKSKEAKKASLRLKSLK